MSPLEFKSDPVAQNPVSHLTQNKAESLLCPFEVPCDSVLTPYHLLAHSAPDCTTFLKCPTSGPLQLPLHPKPGMFFLQHLPGPLSHFLQSIFVWVLLKAEHLMQAFHLGWGGGVQSQAARVSEQGSREVGTQAGLSAHGAHQKRRQRRRKDRKKSF